MEARELGAVGAVGAGQGADQRLPVLHQVRDRLEERWDEEEKEEVRQDVYIIVVVDSRDVTMPFFPSQYDS